MFRTGVLCTVCGAQVSLKELWLFLNLEYRKCEVFFNAFLLYFTKLHTHLKQGLMKYFETAYSRRELNQIWTRIQTSY